MPAVVILSLAVPGFLFVMAVGYILLTGWRPVRSGLVRVTEVAPDPKPMGYHLR